MWCAGLVSFCVFGFEWLLGDFVVLLLVGFGGLRGVFVFRVVRYSLVLRFGVLLQGEIWWFSAWVATSCVV